MSIVHPWLFPGLVLASLWWLLTDGSPGSWLIGLPAVATALWLFGPAKLRLSPVGLLRFLPFFIGNSIRGGLDVALRTLAPEPRVNPELAYYRVSLQSPQARLLFANCVNLLPGTLAADLERDRLRLHLLDRAMNPRQELRPLEQAVARVFRETIKTR